MITTLRRRGGTSAAQQRAPEAPPATVRMTLVAERPQNKLQPRRIFIDCSAVDFAKQPTGIPRVVRKYIEVGYAWGARRGIDIIPVVPTKEGLALVHPVPGEGAPPDLVSRGAAGEAGARSSLRSLLKIVWHYFCDVIHYGLQFAAALLPIPPVKSLAEWIDSGLIDATDAYERHLARKNLASVLIAPEPGDVLFAPAYWHDVEPAIYRALRARGVQIVILVHDILPILFEEFYAAPWRYRFKDNVRAAFDYASAFFCVSDFTRTALREFGQRHKLPSVPMMTAYNGFQPLVSDTAAEEIKAAAGPPLIGNRQLFEVLRSNPLLMVGSVEPKKGHVPVIKCMEALWQAGFQRPLLIIGRPGWLEQDVVGAMRRSFFYNKKIFWFSDADDYDLAAAYLSCHAVILSSLAEGFGIPMIEASHYGKPTIARDTPIVREILGEKALLFTGAAEFVQHVVDLEEATTHAAACRTAESVRWPLWETYTPQVFDRLVAFAAGAAPLPERVSVTSEPRMALREVSG